MATSTLPLPAHNAPTHFHLAKPLMQTTFDNDDAAGRYVANRLATIMYLAMAIADDLVAFQDSRCWQHLDDLTTLTYRPMDFYQLAQGYLRIVCNPSLVSIAAIMKSYPNMNSKVKPPQAGQAALPALFEVASEAVADATSKLELLGSVMGMPMASPSANVANVSCRELRLWCQLNARPIRKTIQNARGNNAELRCLMEHDIPAIIQAGVIKAPDEWSINVKASRASGGGKILLPTPFVYFICTGLNTSGEIEHPCLHIGATQERLAHWPELEQQREAARMNLIGTPAQTAWKNRSVKIAAVEHKTGNKEALRLAVLQASWGGITKQERDEAEGWLRNPLRACGHHRGHEIVPDDFQNAKRFKDARHDVPHSCAEVPASGRYDFAASVHTT